MWNFVLNVFDMHEHILSWTLTPIELRKYEYAATYVVHAIVIQFFQGVLGASRWNDLRKNFYIKNARHFPNYVLYHSHGRPTALYTYFIIFHLSHIAQAEKNA